MAPGALLDTRRPLITCCPPSCSATSFRLGPSKPLGSVLNTQHPPGSPSNALQATRLRAKHSAFSWQPIQCPPGCPALSWLFGHLLVARCTDRSMSSWLPSASVPLAAQRTPGHSMHSRPFGAPWLLGSFLILRCLLAAQTILATVELQEGTKWPGGCRASSRTSNSREDLEWPVECQAARRAPISLERAKWPGGAER